MPQLSIPRLCPRILALLIFVACLAGSCATTLAGEVGVAWDAKTEPEIVGYKIYYQGVTHTDLRSIDVGSVTTYTVTGLDPDTYSFCVTAYDPSGNETGCSNVVWATLSPPMYGFRDASAFSRRGDGSQSLSENHRCSRSAEKDESFAVACRLRNGDTVLKRLHGARISLDCSV